MGPEGLVGKCVNLKPADILAKVVENQTALYQDARILAG